MSVSSIGKITLGRDATGGDHCHRRVNQQTYYALSASPEDDTLPTLRTM